MRLDKYRAEIYKKASENITPLICGFKGHRKIWGPEMSTNFMGLHFGDPLRASVNGTRLHRSGNAGNEVVQYSKTLLFQSFIVISKIPMRIWLNTHSKPYCMLKVWGTNRQLPVKSLASERQALLSKLEKSDVGSACDKIFRMKELI